LVWIKLYPNQPTNPKKRKIKRKPKPNKQTTRQTERNKQKGRERKEEGGAHTHCIWVSGKYMKRALRLYLCPLLESLFLEHAFYGRNRVNDRVRMH